MSGGLPGLASVRRDAGGFCVPGGAIGAGGGRKISPRGHEAGPGAAFQSGRADDKILSHFTLLGSPKRICSMVFWRPSSCLRGEKSSVPFPMYGQGHAWPLRSHSSDPRRTSPGSRWPPFATASSMAISGSAIRFCSRRSMPNWCRCVRVCLLLPARMVRLGSGCSVGHGIARGRCVDTPQPAP